MILNVSKEAHSGQNYFCYEVITKETESGNIFFYMSDVQKTAN